MSDGVASDTDEVVVTISDTGAPVITAINEDEGCKLVGAAGPGIKLVANGVDASGNTATGEAVPGPHPSSKPALAKPVLAAAKSVGGLEFGLDQNFPATTIRYTLALGTDVRLVIYNILGQQVRELVNHAQGPGSHAIQWDGRDAIGRNVATGVYVYHLVAGSNEAMRKMIFTK